MPNFAANISMMFNEYDFLDRFAAASKSGFKAVEFLFPYDYEPTVLKEKLIDSNLDLALFNTSPGYGKLLTWRFPPDFPTLPSWPLSRATRRRSSAAWTV